MPITRPILLSLPGKGTERRIGESEGREEEGTRRDGFWEGRESGEKELRKEDGLGKGKGRCEVKKGREEGKSRNEKNGNWGRKTVTYSGGLNPR